MYTTEDLKQMKDECVNELKDLGYNVLPILDVTYNSRLRSNYAVCKKAAPCRFDRTIRKFTDPSMTIEVEAAISYLGEKWRDQIKTLIMHECIHAVVNNEYPDTCLGTPHGKRYDEIKENVEKTYGYIGIFDETGHGFEDVLPEIRAKLKKAKY